MKSKLKGKWVAYIVFWLVTFFVGLELFSQTGEVRTIDVIYTFLFLLPFFVIVSIHSFHFMPNYLAKSRFWLYGISSFLLLLGSISLYQFSFLYLSAWLFPGYYLVGIHNPFEILGFAVLFLLVSSSLEFGRNWFEGLKAKKQLSELETENIASELKALRAQVNPHFLFNSLNTIYSEALKKSDKAPELILKLSDMLRYVVDKMEQETVPLQEEVDYLSNFIDLHKERLNNPEKVRFVENTNGSNLRIAPLLLLIFVENCFKHADLTDDKALIHISLSTKENQLRLMCKNTVSEKINEQKNAGGAGVQNAKRRLELAYKNQYSLEFHQNENLYETSLKLELS